MTEQETLELDGYRKAYALLQKGMESQAELIDDLKQSERTARALVTRLAEALEAIHKFDPDTDQFLASDFTAWEEAKKKAATALADARAAGLAREKCPLCDGGKRADPTGLTTCPDCRGTGRVAGEGGQ